ncbi:MAG: helix-turn-helix domain-containing protein [Candidatus Deferrimicrobiota bacterium]
MISSEAKERAVVIPMPERVRTITGGFAWIDHRFRRDGHMESLTVEEIALYLFLVLAADRNGVSYYSREKISNALGLSYDRFDTARQRLIERSYIAFAPYHPGSVNGYYQVLPLPERPRAR